VAVIGTFGDAARVIRRIRRHPEYCLDLARILEVDSDGRLQVTSPSSARAGSTNGGESPAPRAEGRIRVSPGEIVDLARELGINRVIVATNPADFDTRSEIIRALSSAGIHVDLVSGEPESFSANTLLHYLEGIPVVTIPAARRSKIWMVVKRVFDVLVAGSGLVVLLPLFAYCAIGIKLSSRGPLLFRQQRIGLRGRRFELLKFRTMVAAADAQKHELGSLNMHAKSDTPGMFKVARDPRVTYFGVMLRRWSIDELPQLWNVFKGDMTLVGPRPLIPEEAELVSEHYTERFRVRPGITGAWQTLGRSDIGFEDMLKLDYSYVLNWSFSEDLKLLLRTIGAVIHARGAY